MVDGTLVRDGKVVARGTVLTEEVVLDRLEQAKATMGNELERFAANTLSYIQTEGHLLIDDPTCPRCPSTSRVATS